jgi:hypothetical protein
MRGVLCLVLNVCAASARQWESFVPAELSYVGLTLASRYRLEEPVAQGALSQVFRGRDEVLRRAIAVKVVPSEHVPVFQAALRATSALTHPAVVASYDAVEQDGTLFLVQEYIQARPFPAYLRAGLPVERATDLAGQMARALAYAHAHGVVHGDLTPAAVVVDRRAVLRLNNFCLPADAVYFATFAHTLEAGQPSDDTRGSVTSAEAADVRAVGLMLWQALSAPHPAGAVPEGAEDAARAFRADVPEVARALVRRCVVCAHPERVTDADTLVLALEALGRELARGRSPLSEVTPPALRVAREMREREAPWSLQETYGAGEPWPIPEDVLADVHAVDLSAPTAPAASFDASYRHEVQQRAHLIAPRIALPSRPVVRPAPSAGPRPVVRTAPPAWKPAQETARGLPVAAVLLIGATLFVLFFLIGFFIQR